MEDNHNLDILNLLPTRVLVLDRENCIQQCNDAFERDAEHSINYCLGKDFFYFFKDAAVFKKFLSRTAASDMAFHNIEGEIITIAGHKLYVNFDVIPLPGKKSSGILLSYKDVSAPKILKEQVKVDESIVSFEYYAKCIIHEIRNPLMAITGASQLLEMKELGETERKYVKMIGEESKRIQGILSDIEMENIDKELHMTSINIHKPLDRSLMVIDHLEAKKKKSIEIVRQYDPSLPDILADQERLVQVFINIIKNAVEASLNNGKILIETKYALDTKLNLGQEDNKPLHYLLVRITDYGAGISKENLSRIFMPLYSSKDKGEGVGLAICHQIIKAHNGTILIDSEVMKYTTFDIYLPITT